jgi:hypothetical protein
MVTHTHLVRPPRPVLIPACLKRRPARPQAGARAQPSTPSARYGFLAAAALMAAMCVLAELAEATGLPGSPAFWPLIGLATLPLLALVASRTGSFRGPASRSNRRPQVRRPSKILADRRPALLRPVLVLPAVRPARITGKLPRRLVLVSRGAALGTRVRTARRPRLIIPD